VSWVIWYVPAKAERSARKIAIVASVIRHNILFILSSLSSSLPAS